MQCLWISGPTGAGKSWWARNSIGVDGWRWYPKELTKWWCGYNDEEVVILDDVTPEDFEFLNRNLRIWADIYPFMAEKKGGGSIIRPKRIVVTSNYKIQEIFTRRSDREPIERRFGELFMKGRDIDNNPIFI